MAMLAQHVSSSQRLPVRVAWSTGETAINVGNQQFALPVFRHGNGAADYYRTLIDLAKLMIKQGWSLHGCGSCRFFRFSGFAYQQSSGRRGYCSLVGFRRRSALVEITDHCGEYQQADGWPGDFERVDLHRQQSSDQRTIDRHSAASGCLAGLIAGPGIAQGRDPDTANQAIPSVLDADQWNALMDVARSISATTTDRSTAPKIALSIADENGVQQTEQEILAMGVIAGVTSGIHLWKRPPAAADLAGNLVQRVAPQQQQVATFARHIAQLIAWSMEKRNLSKLIDDLNRWCDPESQPDSRSTRHILGQLAQFMGDHDTEKTVRMTRAQTDTWADRAVAAMVTAMYGARHGLHFIPAAWQDWARTVVDYPSAARFLIG